MLMPCHYFARCCHYATTLIRHCRWLCRHAAAFAAITPLILPLFDAFRCLLMRFRRPPLMPLLPFFADTLRYADIDASFAMPLR